MSIWLEVVFYNVLLTFIFSFLPSENITFASFKYTLFPVTFNRFWYFSAYTGLFFIMPLINAAVQNTDNASLKKHSLIFIGIYSVFASFSAHFDGNPFGLGDGYSFIWIAILYYLGAVMKKTGLFSGLKTSIGIIALFLLALQRVFISYISPAILAAAIIHVVLFSRIKISPKLVKVLQFAAPGAFAVYIINTQQYVFKHLMYGRFEFLCNSPIYLHLTITFGFAALFVIASIIMDYFRRQLFRILRINSLTLKAEAIIERLFERIILSE